MGKFAYTHMSESCTCSYMFVSVYVIMHMYIFPLLCVYVICKYTHEMVVSLGVACKHHFQFYFPVIMIFVGLVQSLLQND